MKRTDFVFTIGYQGETAIVDGRARTRYGRLGTRELAERGLFKPALSSALFSGDAEELAEVLKAYNGGAGAAQVGSVEQLKRLLGVFDVPKNVQKIKII